MARTPKARSAKRPSTTSKGRGAKKPATKKRATKARASAPTRVMGVAVPKTLTNALDGLVNSPRGRENSSECHCGGGQRGSSRARQEIR